MERTRRVLVTLSQGLQQGRKKPMKHLDRNELLAEDGILAEPGEARIRKALLIFAAIFGPPLLLFAYYRLMFPGLVNSDAMDFAQIGRNLSQGRGFVTYIL